MTGGRGTYYSHYVLQCFSAVIQKLQLRETAMELYGNGVLRYLENERHLVEGEVLDMAHAHYLLVFHRKPRDEEQGRLTIERVNEILPSVSTRLVPLLKKHIERSVLSLTVFVDNQIIENVIEKGLHHVDLPFLRQVLPSLKEGVLY